MRVKISWRQKPIASLGSQVAKHAKITLITSSGSCANEPQSFDCWSNSYSTEAAGTVPCVVNLPLLVVADIVDRRRRRHLGSFPSHMASLGVGPLPLHFDDPRSAKLAEAKCVLWVVCHEYRRSKRRCATVREMKEGPSGSVVRDRSQATASCCRQERWW